MEKPISLKITDLKTNIIMNLQESGLSPILILPVIKEIYEMTANYAEMQCQNEKAAYEQFLQESQKKEKQEDKANEN